VTQKRTYLQRRGQEAMESDSGSAWVNNNDKNTAGGDIRR